MRSHEKLSDSDLNRIFAALTSQIQTKLRITEAGAVLRAAGLMLIGNHQYWAPLMGQASIQFNELDSDDKVRTIRIIARQLVASGDASVRESAESLLGELGFRFVGDTFVPADFFDPREALFLPTAAVPDIATALARLSEGDLDGALTAACGAVDSAAAGIYKQRSLGDFSAASFQKRAMTAIEATGYFAELRDQLIARDWLEGDAIRLCQNLKGSLNQAAYVMQSLRSKMSDAHGSKPVLKALVFDAFKLASVMLSLMK